MSTMRLVCLSSVVAGLAFMPPVICIAMGMCLPAWRDVDTGTLATMRVGQVYSQCCTKSKWNKCSDQTAFKCRSNPACSQGQEFDGTCDAASCGGLQQSSNCETPVVLSRNVDKCVVTGQFLTTGCSGTDSKCGYDYTAKTATGAPSVDATVCSSNSTYCNSGQPTDSCD